MNQTAVETEVPEELGMSCEEYTTLIIAGMPSDQGNYPLYIQARMNAHEAGCEYHRSPIFFNSVLETPVNSLIKASAVLILRKYLDLPLMDHPLLHAFDKSPNEKDYGCGHIGATSFRVVMFGESSQLITESSICPECYLKRLNEYAIRCSACGRIILPRDGVAAYHAVTDWDLLMHDHVATYIDEETVLGCLRVDCIPSARFIAGNWTEKGFAPNL